MVGKVDPEFQVRPVDIVSEEAMGPSVTCRAY